MEQQNPPPPLWSACTAVNIYFTLGPAQVHNISDHCMMAVLVGRDSELLTPRDCQRFLTQSRMRPYNRLSALVKLKYIASLSAMS